MVVSRDCGDGSHLMDLEFQWLRVLEEDGGDGHITTWTC